MSDWMAEGAVLNIFPCDTGKNLYAEKFHGGENFRIAITHWIPVGNFDQREENAEIYLSGRNLEIFREWLGASYSEEEKIGIYVDRKMNAGHSLQGFCEEVINGYCRYWWEVRDKDGVIGSGDTKLAALTAAYGELDWWPQKEKR